jgi:hypothetical protein
VVLFIHVFLRWARGTSGWEIAFEMAFAGIAHTWLNGV